ncbi:hypothetical protein D0T53_04185 [Dysgonomonas sp. 216]|uniref:hypothetical protein n=1 Tax=unclassified Dysgonomonas TaxID=2630389 RepID=UPI0013D4E573|nr:MULTISPECIES: hypothetical protein [unclassified Dysgonomonas]NDV94252.1 hypothetical protein [Dysgonomonas sp. 521]NDW18116.1 hypothetical protein [Dysgonomonas sp. 216]
MNEVFIKSYVLVSLWFWAGMLLSGPLRRAFGDMHRRLLKRIYDATWGQVVKAYKRVIDSMSKRFKDTTLYVENRTYELRVKVARSLVSKELLEELTEKNFVAAISRARQIGRWKSGTSYEELQMLGGLASGRTVDREEKEAALNVAFELCDTDLFEQIITRIPRAQERILLAFEQAEGNAPYDSIRNEEFRKFIRE